MTTTLFATDLSASVLEFISNSGALRMAYCPYGYSFPPGNPAFNGERLDPFTGHYLLGNGYRGFNPVLMRFNSADHWSPFSRGGLNAYAYCAGDPVNSRDPSGHFGISPYRLWKVAIGKVLLNIRSSKVDMLGNSALLTGRQRIDFNEGFIGVKEAGLNRSQIEAIPRTREHAADAVISDYLGIKSRSIAEKRIPHLRAAANREQIATLATGVIDQNLSGPVYAKLVTSIRKTREFQAHQRKYGDLSNRGQGWFARDADPLGDPDPYGDVELYELGDKKLRKLRARAKAIRQVPD